MAAPLEQAQVAVYLACFHLQWILDLDPACEEVVVGQEGQWAWAGCLRRMRPEEGQGSLGQEEEDGRKEAYHSRAAEEQSRPCHRIQEQRLGYRGNREVHQGPGSEPAAGTVAAAGQGGIRKEEGRAAAADQAGHGIEAAVGWEPAGGVAAGAAVAAQGALTAINVSQGSLFFDSSSNIAVASL